MIEILQYNEDSAPTALFTNGIKTGSAFRQRNYLFNSTITYFDQDNPWAFPTPPTPSGTGGGWGAVYISRIRERYLLVLSVIGRSLIIPKNFSIAEGSLQVSMNSTDRQLIGIMAGQISFDIYQDLKNPDENLLETLSRTNVRVSLVDTHPGMEVLNYLDSFGDAVDQSRWRSVIPGTPSTGTGGWLEDGRIIFDGQTFDASSRIKIADGARYISVVATQGWGGVLTETLFEPENEFFNIAELIYATEVATRVYYSLMVNWQFHHAEQGADFSKLQFARPNNPVSIRSTYQQIINALGMRCFINGIYIVFDELDSFSVKKWVTYLIGRSEIVPYNINPIYARPISPDNYDFEVLLGNNTELFPAASLITSTASYQRRDTFKLQIKEKPDSALITHNLSKVNTTYINLVFSGNAIQYTARRNFLILHQNIFTSESEIEIELELGRGAPSATHGFSFGYLEIYNGDNLITTYPLVHLNNRYNKFSVPIKAPSEAFDLSIAYSVAEPWAWENNHAFEIDQEHANTPDYQPLHLLKGPSDSTIKFGNSIIQPVHALNIIRALWDIALIDINLYELIRAVNPGLEAGRPAVNIKSNAYFQQIYVAQGPHPVKLFSSRQITENDVADRIRGLVVVGSEELGFGSSPVFPPETIDNDQLYEGCLIGAIDTPKFLQKKRSTDSLDLFLDGIKVISTEIVQFLELNEDVENGSVNLALFEITKAKGDEKDRQHGNIANGWLVKEVSREVLPVAPGLIHPPPGNNHSLTNIYSQNSNVGFFQERRLTTQGNQLINAYNPPTDDFLKEEAADVTEKIPAPPAFPTDPIHATINAQGSARITTSYNLLSPTESNLRYYVTSQFLIANYRFISQLYDIIAQRTDLFVKNASLNHKLNSEIDYGVVDGADIQGITQRYIVSQGITKLDTVRLQAPALTPPTSFQTNERKDVPSTYTEFALATRPPEANINFFTQTIGVKASLTGTYETIFKGIKTSWNKIDGWRKSAIYGRQVGLPLWLQQLITLSRVFGRRRTMIRGGLRVESRAYSEEVGNELTPTASNKLFDFTAFLMQPWAFFPGGGVFYCQALSMNITSSRIEEVGISGVEWINENELGENGLTSITGDFDSADYGEDFVT